MYSKTSNILKMTSSIKILSRLFVILTLPILILLSLDVNMSWVLVPFVCIEVILIIFKYSKMQVLQMLILYLFVYFLYLIPYFFFNYQLSDYSRYQNVIFYNKVAFLFYLFYLSVLCVPIKNKKMVYVRLFDRVHIRTGKLQKMIYLLLLLFVLVLSIRQGQNVLASDNSYELYRENLESVNSLPLYLILLLIYFPIIFDWNKSNKIIFSGIISVVILFCISRGVRMVLAPAIILSFMVFLEGVLNRKKFLMMFGVGYVFFIFINALKMNIEMQMNMLFSEGSDKMIISHHADTLYCAASCFGLIKDGTLTIIERIPLTLSFLCEIIVPPSIISDEYKFPHIINIHAETGGGGLFLSGAFLMWGYVGVFIFGYFLTKMLTKAYFSYSASIFNVIACIVIVVFFPRWMSYDYHIILKFPFWGLILYYFFTCKIRF